MDNKLGKNDWLRAARLALLHHGPDAVRVEPLARELGVTKGSFYWHFRDRADLLEALLREWEEETSILTDAITTVNPRGELPAMVEELDRRNVASERGESPSDAAIFAWAAVDPRVAARANRVEAERMELFRVITGRKDLADLFYYAYHGFLLRRRRVPKAAGDFASIARIMLRTFPVKPRVRRAKRRARSVTSAVLLLGAIALQGCTYSRIIRHRDPSAWKPLTIFSQRAVQRADVPSTFARPPQRTDLDTVTVRDIDFTGRRFDAYLANRKVKAFVVIRNDSILYERYRDGYTDSTLSSSFSVAKSFTSALTGIALERGEIRSLDDSITKYLPELGGKPDFRGITIRHLLQMRSGFAYSRTNGNWWNDLRSSDAHFYYTTNAHNSISKQVRQDEPGARWAYKDSDTGLLAWVLERATGKSLAQQLEERIWKRIGTERNASWDLDHDGGSENAASGLNAVARDFARFGQLYLNDGMWNNTQVVPREWVTASTTLDTTRAEPEVLTWWQMQHQNLWWLPMQNWPADQDFFADGSRGQRIYVNRRLRTVIVQLANESAQDFPFRKVAHYLAGEPYTYPRVVANLLYNAIANGAGADSLRSMHRTLVARAKADPASLSYSRASMGALAQRLRRDKRNEMAQLVEALRDGK